MDEPSSFWNAFTTQPGSTTTTLSGRQVRFGAALEDGFDNAVGLFERDGGHGLKLRNIAAVTH